MRQTTRFVLLFVLMEPYCQFKWHFPASNARAWSNPPRFDAHSGGCDGPFPDGWPIGGPLHGEFTSTPATAPIAFKQFNQVDTLFGQAQFKVAADQWIFQSSMVRFIPQTYSSTQTLNICRSKHHLSESY